MVRIAEITSLSTPEAVNAQDAMDISILKSARHTRQRLFVVRFRLTYGVLCVGLRVRHGASPARHPFGYSFASELSGCVGRLSGRVTDRGFGVGIAVAPFACGLSGSSGRFGRGVASLFPPPTDLFGTREAYEEIFLAPPRGVGVGDEIESALDLFEKLRALREVGLVLRNCRVMYPGLLGYLPQREAVEGALARELVNCVENSAVSVGEVHHRPLACRLEDVVSGFVVLWDSHDGPLSARKFHDFAITLLQPGVSQHEP